MPHSHPQRNNKTHHLKTTENAPRILLDIPNRKRLGVYGRYGRKPAQSRVRKLYAKRQLPGGQILKTNNNNKPFHQKYREIIMKDCSLPDNIYLKNKTKVIWTFRITLAAIIISATAVLYRDLLSSIKFTYHLYKFYLKNPHSVIGSIVESHYWVILAITVIFILIFIATMRLYTYDLMQRNEVIRNLLKKTAQNNETEIDNKTAPKHPLSEE